MSVAWEPGAVQMKRPWNCAGMTGRVEIHGEQERGIRNPEETKVLQFLIPNS
jgi:hypothetical protein